LSQLQQFSSRSLLECGCSPVAIGTGYHDADGFATCGQDCSTVQYVSAIAFLAPPLLISLAALGMLVALSARRLRRRSTDQMQS
jgi:hypothetical protein